MSALAYPGKDADPFYDITLKAYFLWLGSGRREEFRERYYDRLGGQEGPGGCYSSLQFRAEHVGQRGHYRMQRVRITPYFLWLGWYLKTCAGPGLLARDTLDIALELGARWNAMGQRSKTRWGEIAARECRGKLWRGKNDSELPDWYLDRFG